jgi:hypothetical protein
MMPLKKSAETSYAEVDLLVDRLPVDCCNQALKQPETVLVWYYYGVNEPLQSLPRMPVQVAKATELVFLVDIWLFLSTTRTHAHATIYTFLALRAVLSVDLGWRFDLPTPCAFYSSGQCRPSHAIGANTRSVCQEPPESATDTTVSFSFGLLAEALPTNHHAEQHRSSHLVTTRAHCHWSVSHICLTAIATLWVLVCL